MVNVTLRSPDGQELVKFVANDHQTLIEQMEDMAFDMPYSCRAGSCMTCCVVVHKGKDLVDETLGGDKFIDTDDDQILTCIAGVKKEAIDDPEAFELELEMLDMLY